MKIEEKIKKNKLKEENVETEILENKEKYQSILEKNSSTCEICIICLFLWTVKIFQNKMIYIFQNDLNVIK